MKHEEVKQLKKGQTLYLPVTVTEILDSGNRIAFSVSYASREGRTMSNISAYYEQLVLPSTAEDKPKYDPCRLFKKGDRVRVVEWSGRNPVLPFMDCKVGDIGTVIKDEETTSFFVRLHLEGKYEKDMPYCHLELVTPVEELEPYTLEEETAYIDDEECGILHIYYNYNGGRDKVRSFYENGPESWNATKAAAEAERDRLNAEHRKEQNNG